jgi:hypothetical protein
MKQDAPVVHFLLPVSYRAGIGIFFLSITDKSVNPTLGDQAAYHSTK